MANGTKTLGQRIVEAARLAMIAHLSWQQRHAELVARRETVGGAAPGAFTDERRIPATGEGLRRQRRRRSSCFAEGGTAA